MTRLNQFPATNCFTSYQMQQLVRNGLAGTQSSSAALQRIVRQIVHLRGGNVSWAFDVPLTELAPDKASISAYCGKPLVTPLVIFKVAGDLWLPKIIIQHLEDRAVDRAMVHAFHAAYRQAGLVLMCITESHLASGYLEGRDFKLAFKGAFFCDGSNPDALFCPLLREWNRAALRTDVPAKCFSGMHRISRFTSQAFAFQPA